MTVTEFDDNGTHVTEKRLSYDECRLVYGTSDIGALNRKFEADATRVTDGNCYQWAMYSNGGIAVVTEC